MITKGIRGAITVEENTAEAIKKATLELLTEMFEKNNIQGTSNISHVILTTTEDLNAEFPAKFPRIYFGWDDVAMMCYHELNVPNSLKMCLRILVVINCDENFKPEFVYLKGAKNLRK
ncbi:MAG: chorismate mutase [Muribaculaceae bacterium]|nr:chorismate mutase [Muribaculaceae bacterium]